MTTTPSSETTTDLRDAASVQELLGGWHFALRVNHRAHIRSAAIAHRRGRILGTAAAVLAGIAGTTVFAGLQDAAESSPRLALVAGSMSILAAILASLQTYLGLDEVAERHHAAATRYGALRREIEVLRTGPMSHAAEHLDALRERWDAIDLESPPLSQRRYDRIVGQIRNHESTREE
ncbi:MAG: SLATT domain-containing protein [Acidobacteriota bacterium]